MWRRADAQTSAETGRLSEIPRAVRPPGEPSQNEFMMANGQAGSSEPDQKGHPS